MLTKVIRGTLAEQVAGRLLEYISSQHMKERDLLPSETSLAGSFGVSRPVIREALKNLEGQGVIEIINGKGALIRPIDSDPLRLFFQRAMQMERSTMLELMEVRKGLEVQCAQLAAQRGTEADLLQIRQVTKAMQQNLDNLEEYTRLDVEFHLQIARATHNTMLVYLVESIRDVLRSTIATGLQSRGSLLNLESIQHTHDVLLETLAGRDVEAAMRTMSLHFDEAIEAITHPQS